MARRKKESKFSMLSIKSPVGKQIWLCVLVVCGFTAGCCLLWNHLESEIVENDTFMLKPDKIVVSAQPDWINNDISKDLIQSEKLQMPIDIRDQLLAENLSKAFKGHAWVKDVVRVSKQYPAKVTIELDYRKPVAMVEVLENGKYGLLPVDETGVLLPPDDFSKSQALSYPRILIGRLPTSSDLGEHWGDSRVEEAASIAAILFDVWEKLQLHRIVAVEQDGTTYFEIHTRTKQRIIWGSAPGSEHPQESIATQKLGFLQSRFKLASTESQTTLDLRNPARLSQATEIAPK
ncbi:MAG: cell division protein FtsQ/DivIB [Pirellulales bacterium]